MATTLSSASAINHPTFTFSRGHRLHSHPKCLSLQMPLSNNSHSPHRAIISAYHSYSSRRTTSNSFSHKENAVSNSFSINSCLRPTCWIAKSVANTDHGGNHGDDGNDGVGGNGRNGGNGGNGDDSSDDNRTSKHGISAIWMGYLNLLKKNPIPTKAITSMLLSMFGDLLCQTLIEKARVIDFKRLSVISIIGLLLVGPTLHFWYSSLGSIVKVPGTSGAIISLFLDQMIFSPLFICVFFASLLTLEGRPQEIVPKLKQDWLTTVVTNWKVWIPFQFLNFRFVPLQLQVATANIIALVWNVYLSFSSHTRIQSKAS